MQLWAHARAAFREVATETRGRRRELVTLFVLAVFYSVSYALARPIAESLFLEEYGKEGLPLAWIAGTFAMLAAVAVYARFVARLGVVAMFFGSTTLSAFVLVLLLLLQVEGLPGAVFLLYIWKEVYIVVIVEAFWSIGNLVFGVRAARWVYGLFCAAGSLGGIGGNLLVGVLAQRFGSGAVMWLIVPVLIGAALVVLVLRRTVTSDAQRGHTRMPGIRDVVNLMRRSRYLTLMLLLVAATQVAITLIDYEYNGVLSQVFTDVDERTAVIGWVYAAINGVSLLLQLVTGPVLRFLGVATTLLGIPLLLGGTVVAYVLHPAFGMMATVKIASKAFDYSLFRAAKEILYIPLSYREKTEGKAVVDMLTYRVAKGATSPLVALLSMGAPVAVLFATLGAIGGWIGVTVPLVRRYRTRIAEDPALDERVAVREAG